MKRTKREVVIEAAKRGKSLSEANLSEANLSEANLGGADLRWAYLRGADLSGAYLRRAYLRWADLEAANLTGANLEGANLEGAYLSGANLSEANLRGANLSEANLSGAEGIFVAGPGGSRDDMTYFVDYGSYVMVRCGCFWHDMNVFLSAVQTTHGDNTHGRYYRSLCEVAKIKFTKEDTNDKNTRS